MAHDSKSTGRKKEKTEHEDKPKRPNILFIMVDEMRYPPVYETKEIKEWRKKYLTAQNQLMKEGVEFVQHYTGTTACAPSRATLFTGQYPTLHGVSQVDGAAKANNSPDMFWLDSNAVPTTGDYFMANKYKTWYKGKWHISHMDIIVPGTDTSVVSYTDEGVPEPRGSELYKRANRLDKYGFKGWIGPEPHGSSPLNTGASSAAKVSGRDIVYAGETVRLLEDLKKEQDKVTAKGDQPDPWFAVCSFVNPHDIALYGEVSKRLPGFKFTIDPSIPEIPPAPTADEDLCTKPRCQQSYKDRYGQGFQPTFDTEEYRRLYYSLNLTVDRDMQKNISLNSDMYLRRWPR